MTTIEEKLNKLEKAKPNSKIVSIEPVKIDRRKFNHGYPGGGRPKNIARLEREGKKEAIEKHAEEEVTVTRTDKATGKVVAGKLKSYIAVLEKMRAEALKGNMEAAKAWLDRILGKPKQPIIGGDDDDSPLRVDLGEGFDRILDKAYGNHGKKRDD